MISTIKTPALLRAALVAMLGLAASVFAADKAAGKKAKPAYPLSICVISGDKLEDGDMGPPIDHIYKIAGQPDRLVRLCCKSCIKKFDKEPAKYLKMIDDAAAGKAPNPADFAKHKH